MKPPQQGIVDITETTVAVPSHSAEVAAIDLKINM